MKKKLTTALLALTTLMAAFPMNCPAATKIAEAKDGGTHEIVAGATVTDSDMEELGLNVVVSFPAEIALTLGSDKKFSGSGKVYAYGIPDTGKSLSVTIDSANEAYGKIKYRAAGSSGAGTGAADNYYGTVTETLSKESFSPAETLDNYLKKEGGQTMTHYAELSVGIAGLLPTSGTGEYYTNVPLKISIS